MLRIVTVLLFFLPQVAFSAISDPQLSSLYQQAKRGNANDQLAYAKALIGSSKTQAFKWAQKAADQGSGEAWYWLGQNSSITTSVSYYKKAVEFSYEPAYCAIVDYYLSQGKDSDYYQAKKYADLAKQKNVLIGMDASDSQEKYNTISYCAFAGQPIIPKADLPNQSFKKDVNCDNFLYGLGVPKDLNQYRQCLLADKEQNNNISLAEIYANGWGVPRNPKLALALVCHAENIAPAELYGMVKALYGSRNLTQLQKPFDFCDYITSGFNMGICAAKDEEQGIYQRNTILKNLTAKWPVTHQQLFAQLKASADDYFDTHATSELDMSGTARNAMAIGEKNIQQNQFINNLKNFEAGKFPLNTDIKQADRALNAAYTKIMHADYSDYQMGTITKESIKTTQKKWLKYRDLWIKFAALHYPNTKPESWLTWLTQERTQQINTIGNS